MAIEGWYYLHINGELIYKLELGGTAADIRESDLAKGMWPADPSDRQGAWTILVEGLAAGARLSRINDLARQWGCTDDDATIYAERVGCKLFKDGDRWCAAAGDFIDVQQSTAGLGDTALEAMANLASALGYRPAKMWGNSFRDLLNGRLAIKGGNDGTRSVV